MYEDVFNKCAFKYAMFHFEWNYVRRIGRIGRIGRSYDVVSDLMHNAVAMC